MAEAKPSSPKHDHDEEHDEKIHDEKKNHDVKKEKTSEDKDTITLHIFPRSTLKYILPNPSPFALKLETWLRLRKLPYKVVETTSGSKRTGMIPFVSFHGEEITDSNLIMVKLAKSFGFDLTEGLGTEQKGVARAFLKMLDENTVWTISYYRFTDGIDYTKEIFNLPIPKVFNGLGLKFLARNVRQRSSAHGIGRLSPQEIYEIGKDDFRALSQYLGTKRFLMGDEPSYVDCAAFGHLAQVLYVDAPYPHKEVLDRECTNIRPYIDRIRDRCWPDWKEICPGSEGAHQK